MSIFLVLLRLEDVLQKDHNKESVTTRTKPVEFEKMVFVVLNKE